MSDFFLSETSHTLIHLLAIFLLTSKTKGLITPASLNLCLSIDFFVSLVRSFGKHRLWADLGGTSYLIRFLWRTEKDEVEPSTNDVYAASLLVLMWALSIFFLTFDLDAKTVRAWEKKIYVSFSRGFWLLFGASRYASALPPESLSTPKPPFRCTASRCCPYATQRVVVSVGEREVISVVDPPRRSERERRVQSHA